MGKVVPKQDVLGEMARAIKSQFKTVKSDGIEIKVKSKSCKAGEAVKYTEIIFSFEWRGHYRVTSKPVTLRVEDDVCYLTEMTTLWEHKLLPWPRDVAGARGREFPLSDPDSLSKIKEAVLEIIRNSIKASIPVTQLSIEAQQRTLDSMHKFLEDLKGF